MKTPKHSASYTAARAAYGELGLDTDQAIAAALKMPISMHCWQVDDVVGFETKEAGLSGGGIMATGNYPGRARTPAEARSTGSFSSLRLPPRPHSSNSPAHSLFCLRSLRPLSRSCFSPQSTPLAAPLPAQRSGAQRRRFSRTPDPLRPALAAGGK